MHLPQFYSGMNFYSVSSISWHGATTGHEGMCMISLISSWRRHRPATWTLPLYKKTCSKQWTNVCTGPISTYICIKVLEIFWTLPAALTFWAHFASKLRNNSGYTGENISSRIVIHVIAFEMITKFWNHIEERVPLSYMGNEIGELGVYYN